MSRFVRFFFPAKSSDAKLSCPSIALPPESIAPVCHLRTIVQSFPRFVSLANTKMRNGARNESTALESAEPAQLRSRTRGGPLSEARDPPAARLRYPSEIRGGVAYARSLRWIRAGRHAGPGWDCLRAGVGPAWHLRSVRNDRTLAGLCVVWPKSHSCVGAGFR